MSDQVDRDPRFDWIEIRNANGEVVVVHGECNHLTPLPVRSITTDEIVAWLCPDCDTQFEHNYFKEVNIGE